MYRSVLTEVKVDQVVGLPVFSPADYRVVPLVNRGAVLKHAVLSRLLEIGVHNIWVQHGPTSSIDEKIKSETVNALRGFCVEVAQFWNELGKRISNYNSGPGEARRAFFDADRITLMVRPIIEVLRYDQQRVLAVQSMPRTQNKDIDHLIMRTLFCICLGIELESQIFSEKLEKIKKMRRNMSAKDYQSARDMSSLASGALLLSVHEANKAPKPEEGNHAHRRYEAVAKTIAREMENYPDAVVRMMYRTRQQNYDGSGEPKAERENDNGLMEHRGLKGSEIHLLSRMCRISDVFCGYLLQRNSYIEALSRMQLEAIDRLDPILVDTFLRMLDPFPLGTQVILNTGELCVVCRQNADNPCRPVLCLLDPDPGEDEMLDLKSVPVTTKFIETSLDAPQVPCMDYFFSNITVPLA